jgi:hypothetical protein
VSNKHEQAYALVEKLSRYSLTREMGDHTSGSDQAFDELILEARAIVLRAEKETVVNAKDAIIMDLRERIAYLEEANAAKGETRPITKEEWQENFK